MKNFNFLHLRKFIKSFYSLRGNIFVFLKARRLRCFTVICFEVNLPFKLTALGVLVEVILEFPLGADALPQRPRYHEVGCAQHKQRQQQQDHVEKYIEHLFVYKWLARP